MLECVLKQHLENGVNPVEKAAGILSFVSDIDLLRHIAKTANMDEEVAESYIGQYADSLRSDKVVIPFLFREPIARTLANATATPTSASPPSSMSDGPIKLRKKRRVDYRRRYQIRRH